MERKVKYDVVAPPNEGHLSTRFLSILQLVEGVEGLMINNINYTRNIQSQIDFHLRARGSGVVAESSGRFYLSRRKL